MLFKILHTKQLNTALKTATSSRSRSIFSSNSWWEMCSSGNRTRSVWPGGKYRSIQHMKISEIQTGIFGQMERTQGQSFFRILFVWAYKLYMIFIIANALNSACSDSISFCELVSSGFPVPTYGLFTSLWLVGYC